MTTLSWPATWLPTAFEMRVVPNTRTFASPYSGSTQVLDLGGERWAATFTLPPVNNRADGAAREAFFDRLAGGVDDVALWHFRHAAPMGTLAAAPVAWAPLADHRRHAGPAQRRGRWRADGHAANPPR
jgi:hypothetical protein